MSRPSAARQPVRLLSWFLLATALLGMTFAWVRSPVPSTPAPSASNSPESSSITPIPSPAEAATPSAVASTSRPPSTPSVAPNERLADALAQLRSLPHPPDATAEPGVETFLGWVRQRIEATAKSGSLTAAAQLLPEPEGLVLARRRRDDMGRLIRTNPERALELALPDQVRALLPDEFLDLVERRVHGRGDLEVLCALPAPGQPLTTPPVQRWAVLGDERFEAAVYGDRLGDPTRRGIPLEGIALDGVMAVADRDPELAAFGGAAGTPSVAGSLVAASAATEGTKRLLFIRVDFSDLIGEPFSSNRTVQLVRELDKFYRENSYGRSGFFEIGAGSAVTPVLRMPRTASSYGSTRASTALRNDALAAARAAGFNTAAYDYDLTCIGNVPGFSWAGLGFVGAPGAWIRGTSSTGVVAHELGHNYGLSHANFWDTSGDTVTGPGSSIEYGDKFDTMGAANAGNYHFNARYKRLLGWLKEGEFTVATTNGLYRIHAHDQTNAITGSRGLQIFANARTNYWVEFRQRFTNNVWLMNGAGLRWTGRGGEASRLLDTTPGTAREKDDSAVVLGHTYSDEAAGIHITPVARGTTVPAWLDVMIQRGRFPANRAPSLRLTASALSGGTATTFQFRADATDPDGDPLAYAWQFGDESVGTNSASITHRWTSAGDYAVRCTASDMRGGTAQATLLVRVGSPSTFVLRGRVLAHGEPVPNARINAGSGRIAVSDSDGSYVLPGLARGTYTLLASSGLDRYLPNTFSNPLTVSANLANLDFVIADESAPKPVTIIAAGSEWRYWDQGVEPDPAWRELGYDDNDWNQGAAILGYGGDKETTVVSFGDDSARKHLTTWFRRTFVIEDTASISAARIGLLRDDGAVLHLNGRELLRHNMPAGTITPQTTATAAVSNAEERTYFDLSVDPARLLPGTNVLAVEIHQSSQTSSDIAFDLRLITDVRPQLARGILLTRPADGSRFQAPGRVILTAAVGDLSGGTLDRVEFLVDARVIGTASQAPFSMVWHDAPVGQHAVEARAILRDGRSLTSPAVSVDVEDPDRNPTLVPRGSRWRYLDTGTSPASTWREVGFDDSAWLEGPARLGYGEDGEFTVLRFGPDASRKFVTTWFRHAFEVTDASVVTNLICRFQRDDGALVFLNGVELLRAGLPSGSVSPSQLAQGDVSNDAEQTWNERTVAPGALRDGRNVLAVEIHQSSLSSNDLGFDLELVAQRSGSTTAPELTVFRDGSDLVLRWNTAGTSWQLETTSSIPVPAADWQPIAVSPVTAGTLNELRLPATELTRFFRLRRLAAP